MREQRFGGWIETYTGVKFYPFDPRLEEIVAEDMIHAVCHLCRFGGHSRMFYSVGQHSLLVYRYLTDRNCPPAVRLYGLTHDFTEAYLLDLPRPIKRMLTDYRQLEERLFALIWQSFGVERLQERDICTVKEADEIVLGYEAGVLGINKNQWAPTVALEYPIVEEKPSDVKAKLTETFYAVLDEVRAG
jgi:hypothetical protein